MNHFWLREEYFWKRVRNVTCVIAASKFLLSRWWAARLTFNDNSIKSIKVVHELTNNEAHSCIVMSSFRWSSRGIIVLLCLNSWITRNISELFSIEWRQLFAFALFCLVYGCFRYSLYFLNQFDVISKRILTWLYACSRASRFQFWLVQCVLAFVVNDQSNTLVLRHRLKTTLKLPS